MNHSILVSIEETFLIFKSCIALSRISYHCVARGPQWVADWVSSLVDVALIDRLYNRKCLYVYGWLVIYILSHPNLFVLFEKLNFLREYQNYP